MADTALSTGAPAPATTNTLWTNDRRALRLLASCAANPPAGEYVHSSFALHRECDTHYRYTGLRAEMLDAIRSEYGARLLAEGDRTGDYTGADAHRLSPTVTAAIDAAGLALVYTEAATDLRTALMAVAVAPFQQAEAA